MQCHPGSTTGSWAGPCVCMDPQAGRGHGTARRLQRPCFPCLCELKALTQLLPREVVDVQEVVALGGRADVLAAVIGGGRDLGNVAALAHRRRHPDLHRHDERKAALASRT